MESTDEELAAARTAARAAGPALPTAPTTAAPHAPARARPFAPTTAAPHAPARAAESPFDGTAAFHGDPAPLFAALAKAQGAFPPIPRTRLVTIPTKTGGTIKYLYAPLEEVIDACRSALADNGLCFVEKILELEQGRVLIAYLCHSSGAYMEGRILLARATDAKDFGSMVTYARRYQRQCMLGVAPEDDDDGAAADKDGRQTGSMKEPARGTPPKPPNSPTGQPAAQQSAADAAAYSRAATPEDDPDGRRAACRADLQRYRDALAACTTRAQIGAVRILDRWMVSPGVGQPDVEDLIEEGRPLHGAAVKRVGRS